MRRLAIRRAKDEDDGEEKKPAAAAAKQSRQEALDEALVDSSGGKRSATVAAAATPDAPIPPVAKDSAPAVLPASAGKPDVRGAATTGAADPATGLDTVTKPAQPLSLIERRQRTIDNLAKIGDALGRFTKQGELFRPAIFDGSRQPLLSWRVALLPYLGYQNLYEEFRLDEPWDSPHNKALLARIPEPYQSPERFDEKTNYLLPTAPYALFYEGAIRVFFSSVEDGANNTVAIVEVDDAAAVPWTQPVDLNTEISQFRKKAGTLREDGVFVVWLDGTVGRLKPGCSEADLLAVFTYDAGDMFAAHSVRGEATANPAAEPLTAPPGDAGQTQTTVKPESIASAPPANMNPVAVPAPATKRALARLPIPDPVSMERSRALVRELYHKEYESKQEISQQQAMAQLMLKQAEQMTNDPAGRYVLLDIAIKIATRIGDTATALSALDDLTATYEVDELSTVHAALVALAKKDRSREGASRLLDKARNLIDPAIEQEQFDMAETLCQIGTAAARQLGDRQAANALQQQAERVEESQKALRDVQRVLATLTEKDDPDAHLRVGRYYCFIKGDWEKGLPMLAKGSDTRLQRLAEEELRNPSIPEDQLKLADGWWELGDKDSARQKPFHQRAAYWYERALPALPSGLWRAKVEMRLKEFRQLHGENAAASSRTPVRSPPSSAGE